MYFGGSSSSGVLLLVLAILTGVPVRVAGKRKQKEVKLAMKDER